MKKLQQTFFKLNLRVLLLITIFVTPLPAQHPNINQDKGNVFQPGVMHPGPWVTMTNGEIWPKPKYQEKYSSFLVLNIKDFKIKVRQFFSTYNTLERKIINIKF